MAEELWFLYVTLCLIEVNILANLFLLNPLIQFKVIAWTSKCDEWMNGQSGDYYAPRKIFRGAKKQISKGFK